MRAVAKFAVVTIIQLLASSSVGAIHTLTDKERSELDEVLKEADHNLPHFDPNKTYTEYGRFWYPPRIDHSSFPNSPPSDEQIEERARSDCKIAFKNLESNIDPTLRESQLSSNFLDAVDIWLVNGYGEKLFNFKADAKNEKLDLKSFQFDAPGEFIKEDDSFARFSSCLEFHFTIYYWIYPREDYSGVEYYKSARCAVQRPESERKKIQKYYRCNSLRIRSKLAAENGFNEYSESFEKSYANEQCQEFLNQPIEVTSTIVKTSPDLMCTKKPHRKD